jgi:hypothetical protein
MACVLTSGNASRDQSFDSGGGCAPGEIWTGALAAAAGGFFAAVFLPFAASGGGDGTSDAVGAAPVCVDGRGGMAAFALSAAAGGGERDPGAPVPVPGSGVMMLTGGVLAALGNSALVGRPVGTDVPIMLLGAASAVATGGAFQDGA